MQVTVMSTGASRDTVAFGYVKDLPDEEIRKDFANFSQELGAKPPKLKITRKDGITVAEGKIRGLTDRTTGVIRLDALVQTCRRFGYFWVIYLFPGKAAPPQPVPLEHVRVESRVGGNVAYYQVWVDQSGGTAARLTPAVPPSPMNWRVLAAVTAIAVVVAAGMFLMVYVILGQRRASVAGKGKL
jgi:hypothetical protein